MRSHRLFLASLVFVWGTATFAENDGHRLGGDIFPPENTLKSYKKILERQSKKSFDYAECDLQETKDGKIVVFHDTDGIGRLVPDTRRNRGVLVTLLESKPFATITIQDLTLSEIQRLELNDDAKIPTLAEVLRKSVDWKLKKPLMLEIKLFLTDACREDLLREVAAYRKDLDINFLAIPENFEKSFPDLDKWRPLFAKHKLKVYEALKPKDDKHDLLLAGQAKDAETSDDKAHVYELTVVTHTGDQKNAGTNELKVFVSINDDERFKLNNAGVDDFKRGAVDVFKGLKFKCKPDKIEKFTIEVEGGDDAWLLTKVEFAVKVDGVALTPIVFNRKAWFSGDKNDFKAKSKKDFFLKDKIRVPASAAAKPDKA